MSVRHADLLMAIATILMSLGLMWSSTDGLAIGWVANKGPGSGFWPFWLAVGMLLCSITTIVRWYLRMTPESRSDETYISRDAAVVVGTSVAALFALLAGIHFIGTYLALPLFLLFYFRVVGRHDWPATIMLAGGIPVFIFALFEWALQIPLPKALTEEWFYPVFDIMYETDYFWIFVLGAFALLAAISFAVRVLTQRREG